MSIMTWIEQAEKNRELDKELDILVNQYSFKKSDVMEEIYKLADRLYTRADSVYEFYLKHKD